MSSGMKTLAKETFFYGLGSVFPKLLSWFLSLYWAFVLPRISDIGVLTNFYAWVALLQVILTYGMETGFFRFANKEKDPDLVFSTSFISILTTTTAFFAFGYSVFEACCICFGW
jgi:O-antigen/teichoic acid export membrane protein